METIGTTLSGASTQEATFQFLKEKENESSIFEGSLVTVECKNTDQKILATISSITPHDEFYKKGGAWSQVRREGESLPEGYASKYKLGDLKLLKEFGSNRAEVTRPPNPGSEVYKINPDVNKGDIFDIKEDEEIIQYGDLFGYEDSSMKVPLKIKNIPMHFGIFGVTGSGKSYNAGVLFEKLLTGIEGDRDIRCAYPLLLVDAHGDYTDYAVKFRDEDSGVDFACKNVFVFVMPKQRGRLIEKYGADTVKSLAINLEQLDNRDLAELIIQFRKGAGQKNELQISGLEKIIGLWKEEESESLNQILSNRKVGKKAEKANHKLTAAPGEEGINTNTLKAIQRSLKKFYREVEGKHSLLSDTSKLRRKEFVDNIVNDMDFCIVDFSSEGAPGLESNVKQVILSYLTTLLFNRFQDYATKGKKKFLIFGMEEAQNYCPSKGYGMGSPLSKEKIQAIATQGRKFGLSLAMISQRPAFINDVVLSMLNSYFIHRASPADISTIKKATGGLPTSIERRLTVLGNGSMVISGQMSGLNYPIIAKVPWGARHADTAGTVNPVESIYDLQNKS